MVHDALFQLGMGAVVHDAPQTEDIPAPHAPRIRVPDHPHNA